MTKTEMAQVIVQALRGYDELPKADCARVRNMARHTKAHLSDFYAKALKAIEKREVA